MIPLWGESMSQWWLPSQKMSNVELWHFLCCLLEWAVEFSCFETPWNPYVTEILTHLPQGGKFDFFFAIENVCDWWQVNSGSCNGLMASGNTPDYLIRLPDLMPNRICDNVWYYLGLSMFNTTWFNLNNSRLTSMESIAVCRSIFQLLGTSAQDSLFP